MGITDQFKAGRRRITFSKGPTITRVPMVHQNIDEFNDSKDAVRKLRKVPDQDRARTDPVYVNMKVSEKLRATERNLEGKRQLAIDMRKVLDEQWASLEKDELKFRGNILYFNKFVKENMEKRDRAAKKTVEDEKQMKVRTEAVLQLQKKLEDLKDAKLKMDKSVRDFMIYESYLRNVVEKSEGTFRTIEDILKRYDILQDTKTILAARQEEALRTLENAKNDMFTFVCESRLKILGLNNKASQVQSTFKLVYEHALEREQLVEKIKSNIISKATESLVIKEGIRNLYHQICERKRSHRDINDNDIDKLLEYIKKSLLELKKVQKIMLRSKRHTSVKSLA